ncbi:MAG: hypothetical protein ACREIC_32175 [Limisphaerales bacterium]
MCLATIAGIQEFSSNCVKALRFNASRFNPGCAGLLKAAAASQHAGAFSNLYGPAPAFSAPWEQPARLQARRSASARPEELSIL